MANKIIKAQMKQRRDTKANWAAQNPVLLAGELGIVSDDPNLYKVGDGTTAWNALPFRGFNGTIVQETGTSEDTVMSQKAVTKEFNALSTEIGKVAGGEETLTPSWTKSNDRLYYFYISLDEIEAPLSIAWTDAEYTVKAKGLNADGTESGYGAADWYWLEGTTQTGLDANDKVKDKLIITKEEILASFPSTTKLQVFARVTTSHPSITAQNCADTFKVGFLLSGEIPNLKTRLEEVEARLDSLADSGIELSKEWQSINSRTWYFYIDLTKINGLVKISWSDNAYTVKAKGLNADDTESGYGADDWYWLEGTTQTGLDANDKVDGYIIIDKSAILANYPSTTKMQVVARVGADHSSITAADCNATFKAVEYKADEEGTIANDKVVTVGDSGDFATINEAMQYLSRFYPEYKHGGINAIIRILRGTVINEQILVVGADYSWMTITYEGYNVDKLTYATVSENIANGTVIFGETEGYEFVPVDSSKWTNAGITHDTRGNVCLFRAEDGGRLPKIKCVFKLTQKGTYPVAGLLCNRGSSCVVATLCGFIGFHDGVISNNESSVTIREGITMNCERWGCHARHNGEVSARSVIATGCANGLNATEDYAALSADRIADLDGREAWVSAGNTAFRVANTSRMNCNGAHILGTETSTISATAMALGNFVELYCECPIKVTHSKGAMLTIGDYTMAEDYTYNAVSNKGIIYKG